MSVCDMLIKWIISKMFYYQGKTSIVDAKYTKKKNLKKHLIVPRIYVLINHPNLKNHKNIFSYSFWKMYWSNICESKEYYM
jgi:hypothetical protein